MMAFNEWRADALANGCRWAADEKTAKDVYVGLAKGEAEAFERSAVGREIVGLRAEVAALRQQVAEQAAALAQQKRWTAADGKLVQSLTKGVREALVPRLEALEQRPEPMRYAGIWDETKSYEPNSLITSSGSLWLALQPCYAGERPGAGPTGWRLIQKGGGDGKPPTLR